MENRYNIDTEDNNMKLILAIVNNDDSHAVSSALTKNGFQMTKLATTGGLVEKAIGLIGEESKRRTEVVPSTASYDIGRFASFPVEVQVGGATVFVLDVCQFVKL